MPNTKSAAKRHRQNLERRARNRAGRSTLRTHIRRVHTAVDANDQAKAVDEVRDTTVKLDQAAARGLIHRNKAARLKSRLQRRIKAMKQQASA